MKIFKLLILAFLFTSCSSYQVVTEEKKYSKETAIIDMNNQNLSDFNITFYRYDIFRYNRFGTRMYDRNNLNGYNNFYFNRPLSVKSVQFRDLFFLRWQVYDFFQFDRFYPLYGYGGLYSPYSFYGVGDYYYFDNVFNQRPRNYVSSNIIYNTRSQTSDVIRNRYRGRSNSSVINDRSNIRRSNTRSVTRGRNVRINTNKLNRASYNTNRSVRRSNSSTRNTRSSSTRRSVQSTKGSRGRSNGNL